MFELLGIKSENHFGNLFVILSNIVSVFTELNNIIKFDWVFLLDDSRLKWFILSVIFISSESVTHLSKSTACQGKGVTPHLILSQSSHFNAKIIDFGINNSKSHSFVS